MSTLGSRAYTNTVNVFLKMRIHLRIHNFRFSTKLGFIYRRRFSFAWPLHECLCCIEVFFHMLFIALSFLSSYSFPFLICDFFGLFLWLSHLGISCYILACLARLNALIWLILLQQIHLQREIKQLQEDLQAKKFNHTRVTLNYPFLPRQSSSNVTTQLDLNQNTNSIKKNYDWELLYRIKIYTKIYYLFYILPLLYYVLRIMITGCNKSTS